MDDAEYKLVKSQIQFLTHATYINNLVPIADNSYLTVPPSSLFHVIMMSVFPTGHEEENLNKKCDVPLKGIQLVKCLQKNFNVYGEVTLIFKISLLRDEKYYYFSRGDCYGQPMGYLTPGLKKFFLKSFDTGNKLIQKRLEATKNDDGFERDNFVDVETILHNLTFWPEIGFYNNISLKYLDGIVLYPLNNYTEDSLKIITKFLLSYSGIHIYIIP